MFEINGFKGSHLADALLSHPDLPGFRGALIDP